MTARCPLPWAQAAAAGKISATVGEIAAVGLVGQLAADAGPSRSALNGPSRPRRAHAMRWGRTGVVGPGRTHAPPSRCLRRPRRVLGYCSSNRMLANRGYQYVRARRVAHRRCDVPGASENEMIAAVLVPAGFDEGITACLLRRDRYAGVLNVAIRREEPATERAMILLSIVEGALARLVDVTQSLHAAIASLDPAMAAVVVHVDGRCEPLLDRPQCEALQPRLSLIAEARRRAPRDMGAHAFLWHDDGQLWRAVPDPSAPKSSRTLRRSPSAPSRSSSS